MIDYLENAGIDLDFFMGVMDKFHMDYGSPALRAYLYSPSSTTKLSSLGTLHGVRVYIDQDSSPFTVTFENDDRRKTYHIRID